jgi:hypothetical protein
LLTNAVGRASWAMVHTRRLFGARVFDAVNRFQFR